MRCNRFNAFAPERCLPGASGAYLDDIVALRDLAIAAAHTVAGNLPAFGDDGNRRVKAFYRSLSAGLTDAFERGCDRIRSPVLAAPKALSAAQTAAESLDDERFGLQLCLGPDLDEEQPAKRGSGDGAASLESAIRAALFLALASTSSALLTLL